MEISMAAMQLQHGNYWKCQQENNFRISFGKRLPLTTL
jgi:hypothetical protein